MARSHKKQDINMAGIVDEYNYLILHFQFKLLRSNKRKKKLKTLPANRIQLTVPSDDFPFVTVAFWKGMCAKLTLGSFVSKLNNLHGCIA